jgi:LAO/AO transport system kinase
VRSLGARETKVISVCSLPPTSGIDDLIGALDEHRARVDIAATRTRARRAGALLDFTAEHGERGLRALGGRRAAERLLCEQEPLRDGQQLLAALERAAKDRGSGGR